MRLTTKTRYGMRFMIELAQGYGDGCVPMKDVAEKLGVSKKYLEQVVAPLNSAGLLNVTRGKQGGFELSRQPSEISLADIMSASEDGIELMECLADLGSCANEDGCISRNIWRGLQDAITGYLEGQTLQDVISNRTDECCCSAN